MGWTFEHMPELTWKYGYFLAIGLDVLESGLAMYRWFKKRLVLITSRFYCNRWRQGILTSLFPDSHEIIHREQIAWVSANEIEPGWITFCFLPKYDCFHHRHTTKFQTAPPDGKLILQQCELIAAFFAPTDQRHPTFFSRFLFASTSFSSPYPSAIISDFHMIFLQLMTWLRLFFLP